MLKEYFDNRARPREYEVEDVVFRMSTPGGQPKISNKRWDGPFPIIAKKGTTYTLFTSTGPQNCHVDHLKLWLDKDGMVKTCKIHRAEEFQRQLEMGIEVLKEDNKGRMFPGKDCPEKTRKMFQPLVLQRDEA